MGGPLLPVMATTFTAQRQPRLINLLVGALCVILIVSFVGLNDVRNRVKEAYLKFASQQAQAMALTPARWHPDFGPRDLEAAVNRSEALWQRSVDKREEYVRSYGGWDRVSVFDNGHFTVWDLFTPSWPCPFEVERIGRVADGGKLTCGVPRISKERGRKCVIMSLGVAYDSSWEAEMLRRTDCEIYMYDFSVDTYGPEIKYGDAKLAKRAHFFKYGVGPKDEIRNGVQYYTLETLMQQNGIEWIDILKVDIEGGEFGVLPAFIDHFGDGNLPFDQLLMEIHTTLTSPRDSMAIFKPFWYKLEKAGLRAFSAELNYPSIAWNGNAGCSEVNFINNCLGKRQCGHLLRDSPELTGNEA